MIPEEVAIIADTIAEHYNGEDANGGYDYDEFIGLAYKIYDAIKVCQCN